jgi:small conductance mechanosensitive channel
LQDTVLFGISTAWIIGHAWSAFVALLVLIAGWMLAGFLSRHVVTMLPKRLHQDSTVGPLLSQIVRYGVLIVAFVIVLGQFGVQTASILAVLGTAGLAIALALQGTLSNIAAGILLVLLRPFNVGDTIDADGIAGTVIEIGVFATQLRNAEGVFVFAPNSKLSNAKITNYSREPSRLVELNFNVPRTADIGEVRSAVLAALRADYVRDKPEPILLVNTLADTSVTLTARVAVPSRDWSGAKADLQERLKQALDAANNFAPPAA